ncbi:hypothetical protein XHV734_4350 [Xanthomonas hortorum pv. vitians]|nr:hypothetical protein XHV734_4350 [Xanthomonas hortorum pv. vitians]
MILPSKPTDFANKGAVECLTQEFGPFPWKNAHSFRVVRRRRPLIFHRSMQLYRLTTTGTHTHRTSRIHGAQAMVAVAVAVAVAVVMMLVAAVTVTARLTLRLST